ncbi:MAG: transaldolase [Acidimicrobiales bacterium]
MRRAADILRPVYDATAGRDGFVSFECTPNLADDTDATIAQARQLWHRLDRPNVMIKVPATEAGVPAIEQLTAAGINVNVTLLFSVERYEQIMEAYLRGLERRLHNREAVQSIASVASFFVSRVDTKIDERLSAGSPLRGRVAVANAAVAYEHYQHRFTGDGWDRLASAGAQIQRPLWASTGTKNPDYSDVLYVEALVAGGAINTMPRKTLDLFADHGAVAATRLADAEDAHTVLGRLAREGVDLRAATSELEREGVASFCESYTELLECIEKKTAELEPVDTTHRDR